MKAQFFFPEQPITGYSNPESHTLLNEGIKNKVHGILIDLPCLPTKEMQVDISSFAYIFGFTKDEIDWINDCNEYHQITEIFIKPDRIEIWLENIIDY